MRHPFFASPRPLVFAHRGGGALAPENTIAAFDNGLALGADGLELDVHLSRDGVVVVHHDRLLDRTTALRGPVAAHTADALRRADVPTLMELANDPEAKQIFRYLVSNDEIGRSLFTTPEVPAARVSLLRSAFQKMLADPAFQEEVEKLGLPLSPKSGEEIQNVVLGTFDASPELLNKVKELTKQ